MGNPRTNSATDLPVMPFASQADWERWLEKNHQRSPGVWIQFAKKHAGIPSVTHDEALDVALCFGWIDGQVKRVDDRHFLQRFTPRTSVSRWSKVNCGRAMRLLEAGRMRAAGLRQVEAARGDGRWAAAYDSPRTAAVPDDLQCALDSNDAAKRFFATLDSRNRYAVLYRIQDAKRPETRARRIATFVAMLSRGQTLHP